MNSRERIPPLKRFQKHLLSALTILMLPAVLSLVAPAQAQSLALDSGSPSIEWQRVRLESLLTDQVDHAMSTIFAKTDFVIFTSVTLKDENTPDTAIKGAKTAPEDDPNVSSKLGLDSKMAEAIMRNNSGESRNIFKRIGAVGLTITLDASVSPDKTALAQKLASKILEASAGVKPKIKVDVAQLRDIVPPPAVKEEKKLSGREWIFELKNIIGLILGAGTLTLGIVLIGFMGLSKLSKLEGQKISIFESFVATQKEKSESANGEGQAEATAAAETQAAQDANATPLSEEDAKQSVAKFRNLLQVNLPAASMMFKLWINSQAEIPMGAVAALSKELDHADLQKILPALDAATKKEWKKASNLDLSPNAHAAALKFISQQILDSYLAPPPAIERATLEKILGLSAQDAALIISKDVALGCVLLNLLPLNQTAKIFESLSDEVAEQAASQSSKLFEPEILKKAEVLGPQIDQILAKKPTTLSPFIERAAEMIPTVSPAREHSLFKSIAESKNYGFLEEISKNYFPSSLALKLSADVLRNALMKMNNQNRAELIAAQEGDAKTILLNTIGDPGKKLRDMLDLEISEIDSNVRRKSSLSLKKNVLWRTFVSNLRNQIKNDEAVKEQAITLLKPWFAELTNGEYVDSSDASKGAPLEDTQKAA